MGGPPRPSSSSPSSPTQPGSSGTPPRAYELSFRFAPASAQGQYAGLFNLGQGLADAAGPLVLGVVCLRWGVPGWLAAGAALALIGVAMPAVLGHRGRHRALAVSRPSHLTLEYA